MSRWPRRRTPGPDTTWCGASGCADLAKMTHQSGAAADLTVFNAALPAMPRTALLAIEFATTQGVLWRSGARVGPETLCCRDDLSALAAPAGSGLGHTIDAEVFRRGVVCACGQVADRRLGVILAGGAASGTAAHWRLATRSAGRRTLLTSASSATAPGGWVRAALARLRLRRLQMVPLTQRRRS